MTNTTRAILTEFKQSLPKDLIARHRSIHVLLQRQIRYECCSEESTDAAVTLHSNGQKSRAS